MIQRKYCSTIPVFIKQVFCNAVNIFTTQVKQLIERRHQIHSYIETRIDEQRKTFDPQNIRNLLDLYLEQEGHTDAKMSGTPFSFTNPIYSCKFIKITYSIQRGNDVLFIGIKPNTVFLQESGCRPLTKLSYHFYVFDYLSVHLYIANSVTTSHRWCNGQRARLVSGRSWVRTLIWSSQRL